MIFFKIALRNIARNKYRSLLTISAIAIGLASLIFIRAFVAGSHHQMIENYTDLLCGHIQIHAEGFNQTMNMAKTISSPETIIALIKDAGPVVAVSSRVKEYVLLSSAENSQGVLLIGIEPEKEVLVTRLDKRLRQGTFVSGDDDIVIGKDLARSLNAVIGDKLVIMAQAYDGSLASAALRLKGILDTGAEELDKNLALISLSAAQELFVLGNRVSEIALRTSSVESADKTAAGLNARFNNALVGLETLDWKQVSPAIMQWVEFDVAFINIILFVVLMVVAAGIANTLLMGILERTHEFGIMLALGTKRFQIIQMVAIESLILGAAGTLTGGAAGVLTCLYFGKTGIDLSAFSTALNNYYTGSIIHTRLDGGYLLGYGSIVLAASLLVSIYPAWRAANLKPIEAIRK